MFDTETNFEARGFLTGLPPMLGPSFVVDASGEGPGSDAGGQAPIGNPRERAKLTLASAELFWFGVATAIRTNRPRRYAAVRRRALPPQYQLASRCRRRRTRGHDC